jgi:hypothetical protein
MDMLTQGDKNKILLLTYESRKIYDRAFKEAVQLSYERHNISELARN